MRSVADALRRDTYQRVLGMAQAERIALALSLGDDDLNRYMRASGCSRAEALADMTARHAAGRTPSRAASPGDERV